MFVKHSYKWLGLGLVLALLVLLAGGIETTAKLVAGVQAKKAGDEAVELKMTADKDGKAEITIGANKITFRLQANKELDTGLLRISGDEVLIKVFADSQLTDECGIPVKDIPTEYKRFCYDKTPPVVRVSTSPSPNANGWNKGPVTITITAEDEEGGSGIKAIYYKIGTRSPVEVGVSQLTLSQGGRVATYSFKVSDEGTHQLGFWAVDQAGNESQHQALTLSIDMTPPTISLSASSPAPGEPAIVSWEITDALSGVDPASCLVTISGPGITGVGGWRTLSLDCYGQVELRYEEFGAGNFTVRIYARDVAGNEAAEETSVTLERPLGGNVLIYYGNGGAYPGIEERGVRSYTQLKSQYEARGFSVSYTSRWPSDLEEFCLIILPTPGTEDDSGANFYAIQQVEALKRFLQNGGRLVVLGDHGGGFGINTVNDLLAKLGVGVTQNDDDYLGGYESEPTSDITPHLLTEGVRTMQFAASSSLTLSGTAQSLVRGPHGVTLIAVDRPAWVSSARGGEVVVSGDSNIIDDAWFDDADGDNLRFFENLAALCIGAGPISGRPPCAEPGNTLEAACPVTLPFTGRFAIETPDDRDFFRFSLAERTSIRIEVAAREIGSELDSYLCLYDHNGRDITCDDDSGPDTDSLITVTLDPGVYYIEVRPYSGTGPYELRVRGSGH